MLQLVAYRRPGFTSSVFESQRLLRRLLMRVDRSRLGVAQWIQMTRLRREPLSNSRTVELRAGTSRSGLQRLSIGAQKWPLIGVHSAQEGPTPGAERLSAQRSGGGGRFLPTGGNPQGWGVPGSGGFSARITSSIAKLDDEHLLDLHDMFRSDAGSP
jgi:hypothetical protein